MVPVPGFPRPLYPPSAKNHGKTPSKPGPDVQAYKRTISRAGRWPWQQFDQSYSDAFALGDPSSSVPHTGVAGVQRQQDIEPPTGWVGETTFNTLRSIVIPQGLPNAGQMAMDVTAQNLIGEAWLMFHPPPPPKPTIRERALDGAIRWIGYKESPAGTNETLFGQWYGANFQPWCAMFATYCFEVEAGGSASFARGERYAFVPTLVDDARAGINGLNLTKAPVPGDLVAYDWQRDGTFDHVGIFETGTSLGWTAVEGNTSLGSNSNGGEVMRRARASGDATVVFINVAN